MSDSFPDLAASVSCHRCGYDVRAQPVDGECPECHASVAESRRVAAIPIRPAWRDSDPRWRRRMIAAAWVLTLVPLVAVLEDLGWTSRVSPPKFSHLQAGQSLDETLLIELYDYLVFCIGVVLLFSREGGRRAGRFDSTRRWGIVGSYLVLLLGFTEFAFIAALVMLGIAAVFHSMPLAYEPAITPWLVRLGRGYLVYGAAPGKVADTALACGSSLVVLLGCVPLFNALRSSGPKVFARVLLIPLVTTSVFQIGGALLSALNPMLLPPQWVTYRWFFFNSSMLAHGLTEFSPTFHTRDFFVELAKWLACAGSACWLSIAQIAAFRHRRAWARVASGDAV